MSEFVQLEDCDGVSVSYTTETPRTQASIQEPPALPPHVLANVILRHELECEYLYPENRRRRVYRSHVSTMKFGDERSRQAYWAEYFAAIDGIKAREPKPAPRQDTYEDVMRKFGADFVGDSEVMPHQRMKRTMLHGEL